MSWITRTDIRQAVGASYGCGAPGRRTAQFVTTPVPACDNHPLANLFRQEIAYAVHKGR